MGQGAGLTAARAGIQDKSVNTDASDERPDASDRSVGRYGSPWHAGIFWELPLGRLLTNPKHPCQNLPSR